MNKSDFEYITHAHNANTLTHSLTHSLMNTHTHTDKTAAELYKDGNTVAAIQASHL